MLGDFQAGKGVYVLDLDVLQDGSRLTAARPAWWFFEAGFTSGRMPPPRGVPVFLCYRLLLAAAGTYLIIRSAHAGGGKTGRAGTKLLSNSAQGRNHATCGSIESRWPRQPSRQVSGHRPPHAWAMVLILAGLLLTHLFSIGSDTRTFVALDTPFASVAVAITGRAHSESNLGVILHDRCGYGKQPPVQCEL